MENKFVLEISTKQPNKALDGSPPLEHAGPAWGSLDENFF